MHNVLQDLEVAALHRHDIEVEIEHNRLVDAALKVRGERSFRAMMARYLKALRPRHSDGPPPDPRKN